MIHAHISEKRDLPWWAAVAVPLVGVPLMVGLLALAGPPQSEVSEIEAGFKTEQVKEIPVVDRVSAPRGSSADAMLSSC